MTIIKRPSLYVALIFITVLSACGISRQTREIKAFEGCTFRVASAQKIIVAGTDVRKVINDGSFDLGTLPGLALGLLNKNIPLKANISLEITNPQQEVAAINQFEYRILVGNEEIAYGLVDRAITVNPGQQLTIPLDINSNIYALVSNPDIFSAITRAVKQRKGAESLGVLTLKLKPTIMFGGGAYKYPGYITISKEITTNIFR